MSDGFDVAVVGATGAVGEALVEILEERSFPVRTLHLLASERSEGKRIQFRGSSVMVRRLDQFDFSQVQIGLLLVRIMAAQTFVAQDGQDMVVVIDLFLGENQGREGSQEDDGRADAARSRALGGVRLR